MVHSMRTFVANCMKNLSVILFVSALTATSMAAQFNVVEERAPFPGYLYRPDAPSAFPAILLLHGSEGGNGAFWHFPGEEPRWTGKNTIMAQTARYYASLGYVTYALCYFDCKHHPGYEQYPPDELRRVDIFNITYAALDWLAHSTYVAGKGVALYGGSRGAEQVLLLSSLIGNFRSLGVDLVAPNLVIALSPSPVVAPAFEKAQADAIKAGRPMPPTNEPAWVFVDPYPAGITIPVEYIPSPLLVTYGSHDDIWGPSVNPLDIYRRLIHFGISGFFLPFSNNDDISTAFAQIQSSTAPAVFINHTDEGHWPAPGSPSAILQNQTVQHLLNKYLNL